MALQQPPPAMNDRRRVKVYELKNNDWFDRGTGFCTGRIVNVSILQETLELSVGKNPEKLSRLRFGVTISEDAAQVDSNQGGVCIDSRG